VRGGAALLLLTVACAPRVVWMGGDLERRVHASILARRHSQWVRVGATDGPTFDAIATGGILFSPDAVHSAYAAQRGGRWYVVSDGKTLGPWDGIAEPTFGSTGRLAFLAQTGQSWQAVVDGHPSTPSAALKRGTLAFSPDGQHAGWVSLSGPGCAQLAFDGRLGPCHEGVASFRMTDGGPVAILHEGGKFRLLQGDNASPPVDAVDAWAVSRDGQHVAYAAARGKRWEVLLDGRALFSAERVRDLRFGDEGRRFVFVAVDAPRARVVVDGTAGPTFLLVGQLAAAPRGTRVVYAAEDKTGAWVVVDGEKRGPFSAVLDLALSADGSHLAYVIRKDGRVRVIHDGDELDFEAVVPQSLVLSEDGKHWAVVAGEPATRRLWISLDGRRELPASSDDVFGDERSLRPWLRHQLALSVAAGEGP
jgi:hypothetical protein